MMAVLHTAHATCQHRFWEHKPPRYLKYALMKCVLGAPVAKRLQGILLCCNGKMDAAIAALLRYQQTL